MTLSNADYDILMREFEETRDRHQRERDERVRAAEAEIPELIELNDELRQKSLAAARQKLSAPSADTGWLSKETALILARKRQLLLSHGYAANALSLQYDCPACEDTGLANGKPCRCFQKKAARLLSRGLPPERLEEFPSFSHFSFAWYSATIIDEFSGKSQRWLAEEAVRRAICFTEEIGNPDNNLFLYGNVGVGKTYLLLCIAERLLSNGYPVYYFDAGGLFDLLADAAFRRNGRTAQDALSVSRCQVLLLDDLGTEHTNAFVKAELFQLLNERRNAGLSTVVSSNLDLNGIGDLYGERVSSRLIESNTPIRMVGSDIRLQKRLYASAP